MQKNAVKTDFLRLFSMKAEGVSDKQLSTSPFFKNPEVQCIIFAFPADLRPFTPYILLKYSE